MADHEKQLPSEGLVALHYPDLDPWECGECGERHPEDVNR